MNVTKSIAGLLALFLTILFVVKGTSMFPATAALAWAVLAYICVDFGFLNKVIEISPGNEQMWRAGTEVALAATFVVFLFAYLNLNRWHGHFSYGALVWILGLVLIAGVAIVDPAVAAGIARISFAATALTGLGLIIFLGIRGYDRAIMHQAKRFGGDRIEPFRPAFRTVGTDRLQFESDLRRAIERREFTLAYQPIVRLEDGSVAGFEALLRWDHPRRGMFGAPMPGDQVLKTLKEQYPLTQA